MKRRAASRMTGVTAAVLALLLGAPIAGPASADEASATGRQSWSLDEAREHSDEFFGTSGTEADLVPATDLDPDSAGSDDSGSSVMPMSEPESMTFPAPGSTTLTLPEQAGDATSGRSGAADGSEVSGKAGGLAVTVRASGEGTSTETHGTSAVRVTNVDRAPAHALGAAGGVLTIERVVAARHGEARAGGDVLTAADGLVDVSVDVSHLAGAGGDLAHRLQLVELPACALTTPEKTGCRTATPVENADLKYGGDGVPDAVTGTVSLAVEDTGSPLMSGGVTGSDAMSLSPLRIGGEPTVLAITAEESGSTGDWGATPLSPSAKWDVSTQTGAFSWSYPMRTSPVPGGLAPDLSLSYSSGALDGRVASTNNQSSQIGDGWAGNFSGYIERKYVPCTEDQSPKNGQAANNANRDTGDLCWRSNNATLMFNGSATELVRDGNTDTWRPRDDDNSVVSHVTGGWNTADNPEYWKLTTADGTQYWFGRAKRSADESANMSSTDVVPVYGNHPGEPCYAATFADSKCSTGWRWNLDYVVDTSGNSITYFYKRHNNRYGYNNDEGTQPYNRASQLERIEYGTRAGNTTTPAPARVVFSYAERCLATSTFDCAESKLTEANSAHWPDVPQDQLCSTAGGCPEVTSPAFFDRKRLTGVTTQVRKNGAYVDVDHWSLRQTFPNPGDGTTAKLWLESIKHTGRGGSATDVSLPAVTFDGRQLDNRVDETGDHGPAMTRWRIDRIRSESGGLITVNYSPKQCSSTNLPGTAPTDLATNEMRCQPVYWTPAGFEDPVLDWFHHYRVTSVVENAQAGGYSAPVETRYLYGASGPKWHYDDNELVRPKHRTWGELRGYGIVSKYVGAAGDPNAPRVRTRYRYFQGMYGDRNGAGGTKSDQVDGINDLDHFSGMLRQEWSYSDESEVVETTLSTPWRSVSSATDPESGTKAFHTGVRETETRTALAAGGNRTSRVTTEFDSIGMPVAVSDLGNVGVTGDERCTRTTYIRNAGEHILDTAQRVTTHSKSCDVPAALGDLVSDERFAYDSRNVGVVPTRGLITLRQEMNADDGSTPVAVDVEKSKYNTYGQLIEQTDANGNATSTAYDNTNGLTTKVTVTSPDPDGSGALGKHVSTTEMDPIWGVPTKVTDPNNKVTTGTYDGLGRLTHVWEPGRVQGTHTPNTKYTYMVRDTGVNAVKTETLNHDGSEYVAASEIYDGLLRQRQTQAPTASASTAGRVISDWFYDSRGLATLTRDRWSTSGAAVTTLAIASGATDNRTDVTFDGAGRPVREFFQVGIAGEEETPENYLPKWETLTSYEGDRVKVVPFADPATGLSDGGVPTTTISDVRGNTVELREHRGGGTGSASESTTYRYDAADRLVGVTDPAGNEWSYGYDLRGRQTSADDPDKGDSTTTYDAVGNVVTATDARGEKLFYTYDALNRKTSMRDDTASGALRARWTYDTVAKGQLASSIRVDGDDRYTTTVTGYNGRYQPTGETITLPPSLGAELAGDYTSSVTYTTDGRIKSQTFPAAGGIGEEEVTNVYSATNVADGMGSAYGWGNYVLRADFLPTGEVSYLRTAGAYTAQQETFYERGTRRATGSTVFQQTPGSEDGRELSHASYAYDNAGNVLSAKDVPDPAVSDQPSDQQCFTYDWARRLTEAWTPADGNCGVGPSVAGLGGGDPYWMSYSYDVLGNRTGSVVHQAAADGGDITSTYAYPESGAASVRPHAVSEVTAAGGATGVSSYSYDAAGNMTARRVAGRAGQALAWDAEGELAGVSSDADGDGSVESVESDEYVYTADGERLVRRQGGATTVYLGGQEVTVDASGNVSAERYYAFAGKTVAVRTGNLFSHVTALISDVQNTAVFQIVPETAAVTRRYLDPFGADRGSAAGAPGGGADDPEGWVGDHGFLDKPVDATGLTAVGARMYDAVLGRFISVDPVMDLSDPQQWNAYSYSGNNPTTYSDASGLREICETGWTCDYGGGGEIVNADPVKEDKKESAPPVLSPDPQLPDEFDPSDEIQVVIEKTWESTDEILEDLKKQYGPTVRSLWEQYLSTSKYYRQLLGPVSHFMTFEDYCRQNSCTEAGWGGFYKDGAFWLTVNQTVNEELISLGGGLVGGAAGAASIGLLGAMVGTVTLPVVGTIELGTVGTVGGGALGAGAGSVAGAVVAAEFNRDIRRRWQDEGLVD